MNASKCILIHLPLYVGVNTLVMLTKERSSCRVYTVLMRSPWMITKGLNFMFCCFCLYKLCNMCIWKEPCGGRNQDIFLFLSTLNKPIVMLYLKNEIRPVWNVSQQNIRCFLVVHVLVFYITYIFECMRQSKSIITSTRAVSLNLTARIRLKTNLDFEEVQPRWEKCSQF